MGEVAVGDELIGADGKPTRVVAATDVMLGRPCFEVEFSDGTVIVADAEHQWLTDTRASRKSAQAAAVGTTVIRISARSLLFVPPVRSPRRFGALPSIAASTIRSPTPRHCRRRIATFSSRPTHWVRGWVTALPRLPRSLLRIRKSSCASRQTASSRINRRRRSTAIRLGELLGRAALCAGNRCAASQGADVWSILRGRTFHVGPSTRAHLHSGRTVVRTRLCQECRNAVGTLQARLRTIGVLGNKHIPSEYLRASESQRRALLAGLLDTDGTVTAGGAVQFCVTERRLADDVAELMVSLVIGAKPPGRQ